MNQDLSAHSQASFAGNESNKSYKSRRELLASNNPSTRNFATVSPNRVGGAKTAAGASKVNLSNSVTF